MIKTMEDNKDKFGGNLGDIPNEKYAKFFATFNEIDTLEVSQWKTSHLIGYFCRKYKQHYNIDFSFKFNSSSPSKCFEVFQIKRLAMLLSKDPVILKEYIDWVFRTKVPQAKRRLTSISFLTNEGTVSYYKMQFLFNNQASNGKINRATPLPANYSEVFGVAGITANNYGDLAFMLQMEMTPELESVIAKLEELGFDRNMVSKIV
jgi:hypothetical protein